MTQREFENGLRILISIDMSELEDAGAIARGDKTSWEKFRDNPWRWLIRVDDDTAAAVWTIIERRSSRAARAA